MSGFPRNTHDDQQMTGTFPMTEPAVDVVILSWNDPELLAIALESALRSTNVDVRATIVDNGSQPPVTAPDDPRVTVIRNGENRGVGPARAQAIRATDREFICLLDSDAELLPDALATMVAVLEESDDVAVAAPVFQGQLPKASAGRAPTLGVKVRRALTGTTDYDGADRPTARLLDVDIAIGACQVLRRSAYDAIGGLDTSIFYGPEDIDLCMRFRLGGWRVVQVTDASCIHPPRRRNKSLLTKRGAKHAVAVSKHLIHHRKFESLVGDEVPERYDIHGLCSLEVDPRSSSAPIISEMLGHFSVPHLDAAPDLSIVPTVERAATIAGVKLTHGRRGPGFVYGDGWFTVQKGAVLFARSGDRIIIGAEQNVDRSLLTLVDWIVNRKDIGIIHASAVGLHGKAAIVSGWGGVGKTATLARLCLREGGSFIADDMVFLSADADAYALPKPLFVYPYHAPVFPELFASDHKPLVPASLTPVTEVVRTAVRPLFTISPPLENWARKHTPEHMKTRPEKALPGVEIADHTPLGVILRLEKGTGQRTTIHDIDSDEIVEGLVSEFFGEQTAGTGLELPLAGTSSGIYALDEWMDRRRSIMRSVVAKTPTIRIELSVDERAESTAEIVSGVLLETLS